VRVAINEALMKLRNAQRDKFVPLHDASQLWSPRPSQNPGDPGGSASAPIKEILRLSPQRRNEILRFTMGEREIQALKNSQDSAHSISSVSDFIPIEKEIPLAIALLSPVTSISFHEQLRRSTYIFTAITRPSDVRMARSCVWFSTRGDSQ